MTIEREIIDKLRIYGSTGPDLAINFQITGAQAVEIADALENVDRAATKAVDERIAGYVKAKLINRSLAEIAEDANKAQLTAAFLMGMAAPYVFRAGGDLIKMMLFYLS